MESSRYWPAEWERQTATWIAWPHNLNTWPNHFQPIPNAFLSFIKELSKVQRVHVLGGPEHSFQSASEHLGSLTNVVLHAVETNDVWIRDYGPTFVRHVSDGQLIGVDWCFNAWGGKYPPYDKDQKGAEEICRIAKMERSISTLHCEGGGIETDGKGTLLTTSSVLMNPTRNPGWSRGSVEKELRAQLGISKIVWVDGGGMEGDDTDGHIDQLARFVAPEIVVAAVSSDANDPNHHGLQANVQILEKATDAAGKQLQVIPLPTPPPRFVDGIRVPESYCNFLFANEIVLLPTFRHDLTDRFAIRLFESLCPDRRIIPLDAYDLIFGLGAFHCASQQQPAPESVRCEV